MFVFYKNVQDVFKNVWPVYYVQCVLNFYDMYLRKENMGIKKGKRGRQSGRVSKAFVKANNGVVNASALSGWSAFRQI